MAEGSYIEEITLVRRETFTGHHGLDVEAPLLFEEGSYEACGVDVPDVSETLAQSPDLAGLQRSGDDVLNLPALSEPQAMRHYVRLSRLNFAIDLNMYPLGSCTMKHNPRLNEKLARLPGFADLHPLQPLSTVQGALSVMEMLSEWLIRLTGMSAVALSPKAGAHGELCGMMAIKQAILARGEEQTRRVVLVPQSAHGTNPATAAALGFDIQEIKASPKTGIVDVDAVRPHMGDHIAGIMLTNPNTCGLFEPNVIEIAALIHDAGGYFYGDGANFNAIVGKVDIAALGVDAMHINLHKTFSTPHGGGGPGSGPVVLSERLAPYAPVPFVRRLEDGSLTLVENREGDSFGRMTAFHGQFATFVRALSYILSHGIDGLKQASEDAVLNANYIKACLEDLMSLPFAEAGHAMHEVLFSDAFLDGTGVSTLDLAKAMIDEGFHPMTMYFPLVVKGALLIEPTESESKATLDLFIGMMRDLVFRIQRGEVEKFKAAPHFTPRQRLDEALAARQPRLVWD